MAWISFSKLAFNLWSKKIGPGEGLFVREGSSWAWRRVSFLSF
jgi:hypothetical protein